jgi:UDP-N-acetylmuramyl pentapeptide phosphotransferase/UDP-N-acetylglucosamine-1-phosphate transferase
MDAGANLLSMPGQSIILLVGSVGLSAAIIIALRPLLVRYALARPNARSSHKTPTPQGGGIAIIGAMTIVLVGAILMAPSAFRNLSATLTVLACAIGLGVVGAIDDIRPLQALPRLVLQAAAVLAVLIILPSSFQILSFVPLWCERILLFLAMLWFVNLVNFMDGIDWMTVAEVVPITGALAVFGYVGALPHDAMLVSLALCGAMIGFAPFNRPVARLFLGDVGSLPIGLLVAWLLVILAEKHLAAALLLPLYYLADATITLVRRLASGQPLMQAHRNHFYQRAFDGGLSATSIVSRVFSINVALALLAAGTLFFESYDAQISATLPGCVLVGWLLYRLDRSKS